MLIGISGGSGSGKTTLARRLISIFGEKEVCLISQDSYYRDQSHLSFSQRERTNYDIPDAFDYESLIQNLMDLKKGNTISKPIYNFETHTREKKEEPLSPQKIMILEGILIFHEKALRDLCDLKIFLDIAESLRFERRLLRDVTERGRSRESVVTQWSKSVQPMFERYILKTRQYADVVFPEDPTPKDITRLIGLIEARLLSIDEEKTSPKDDE